MRVLLYVGKMDEYGDLEAKSYLDLTMPYNVQFEDEPVPSTLEWLTDMAFESDVTHACLRLEVLDHYEPLMAWKKVKLKSGDYVWRSVDENNFEVLRNDEKLVSLNGDGLL